MSVNQQDAFNIPGDQAKTIDHHRGGVLRPDVQSSLISNISLHVDEDDEVEQTGQRSSPPIKKRSQNLMQEDQQIMKKVAIPIPSTLDRNEGSGSEINARKVAARKRMSKSQLNLESPNDYSEDVAHRQNAKKHLIRRDNSQSQGFTPSEIDSEFRNKKQGSDAEENMYEPDSSEDNHDIGSGGFAGVRLDYENIDIEQIDSDDHQEHNLATANNSEEGSEMIMSDSSQGLGQQDDAEQLQNINNMQNPQVEDEEEKKEEDEDKPREEMGGILIYDSYAKFKGCDKIDEYFDQLQPRKVQTDILFSKNEIRDVQRDLFGDKARERDFGCEQDKLFFRNMPRFQPQRDFACRNQTLYIPNQQNILIFDSRFENGNLRKVAKVSNIEYNLWLENDMNTKGHTQWYYFKVVYKDVALHAEKKTHRVKMNILNLAKTTSLYQIGMKPCIWSKRAFENRGEGWTRGGDNITYAQNKIPRYENAAEPPKYMKGDWKSQNTFLMNNNGAGEGVENYYTFSFTYEFEPNQDDEVWFAHAIPYTYTDMQEKLAEIRFNPSYSDFLKMNIQCFSLGKNPVPLITITENISTYLDYYEEMRLMHQIPNIVKKAYRQKYARAKKLCRQGEDSRGRVKRLLEAAFEEEIRCFFEYNEDHFLQTSSQFQGFGNRLNQYMRDHENKKAIFITSRVHPGEPQASHMLDGFLKYLLSDEAAILRKHFVFRIVPMLNPDGVIYGNYRCSLLGCDLNRKWEKPNRLLHPTIFHSKQLIRHMHQERKIVMYCDLHGHSRKNNAFFYGCSYKNYEQEGRIKNAQLRIIPLLCCQRNNLFSLKDCKFGVEKCKDSTARVVVWREMNIMNAFTLECSFFGKSKANQEDDEHSPGLRKKRKIQHFDLEEYNSLGKSLLQTIHSYLPSEQSKLSFISGKILDVFYEEFIKFIPPYILKREEEKRKKLENNQQKDPTKAKKTVRGVSGMRTRDNNTNSMTALNLMRRRSKAQNPQATQKDAHMDQDTVMSTRQRSMLSGIQMDQNQQSISSIQEKVGSEQRAFISNSAASGKDDTDVEIQKFQAGDKQPRKADMIEFESFITGIQHKIKIKERIRKKKIEKFVEELVEKSQQQKKPEPIFDDKGNVRRTHLDELNKRFADDSSSGSTSEEETFKTAQKKSILEAKKQKQMEKTIKKLLEKRENKRKREKQTQKAQSNSPSKLEAKENKARPEGAKREKSKTITKVSKQKAQVADINNSQSSVDARNTYTNQNFSAGNNMLPHALANSSDIMQIANIKALVNKAEKNSHGQIPINQAAFQTSLQQSMQYSKQISSGRRFKQPPSFNSDAADHNGAAANVMNLSNSNDLARDSLSISQLNEDQLTKFQNHYLINSLKTRKSQDDTGTAMSHIQIEDMQNDNLNFLPVQPRVEIDKNVRDGQRKYVADQRNSQLSGTHQSIQKANSQIDITRNVGQGMHEIGRVQTYARADHASLGKANHNAFGTQKDFRIKEGSKQRHPPRLQQLSGEAKKEKHGGPKIQQTYEFDPNDPYKKSYNSHGQAQSTNANSAKNNQDFRNLNDISKMREGDHLHLHFILVGVDKNSVSRSAAHQQNLGNTQSDDEHVVVNQNLQFNDKTQKIIKQGQYQQQMKLATMQRSQLSSQISQLTKEQQIQQQKSLFIGRGIPQGDDTPNEGSYRRTADSRPKGSKKGQGSSTNPPSLSTTGQNGISGKISVQQNPNMGPIAQPSYEPRGNASPTQEKNLKNMKKKIYESNIQDLNKARQNILQAHSIVGYNKEGSGASVSSQHPVPIESKTTMRKSKVYQSPKTNQNNGRRFNPSEPVTFDMLQNPSLSKSDNKNMGMSNYMQSHVGQNLVQVRPLQARQNFSHVDQQDSGRQQSHQILGAAIGNQYTINRLKKQMMRAPAIVNNQITQTGTNINIYLGKEGQHNQISNQNLPPSNPLAQGNHVNLFSDMSKELNSDVRLQNMMRQQQMTQLQRQKGGSSSQQHTGKPQKQQRQPYAFDDLPMVGKISAQTAQKPTQQSQLSSMSGKKDMLLKSALNYQNIHATPSKYHMGNQLFNNSVETIQKQPLSLGNQMVPLSSLPKGGSNVGAHQHRKDHMVQQIIQLVQKNQTSTYVAAKESTNQAGFQLPLSLNPPAQSVLAPPPDRYSASATSNGGLIPKTQKISSRKGRKL